MHLKLLNSSADDKLGKLCRKYISAHRALGVLISCSYELQSLEKAGESAHPFYKPVIHHTLTTYVAIFNSSDSSNNGIGSYDIGQIFPSGRGRELHDLFVSYRNKEIAHLTDYPQKTFLISSEEGRDVSIFGTGERDLFCNICQPGQPLWVEYVSHIQSIKDFFSCEVENLKKIICEILKKMPPAYFQNLKDIPESGEVVDLVFSFLKSIDLSAQSAG